MPVGSNRRYLWNEDETFCFVVEHLTAAQSNDGARVWLVQTVIGRVIGSAH